MPLTKADLRDAALLLKAGNANAARSILSGSNDPRAIELLDRLEARFPTQPVADAKPNTDLAEVKRLISQKKFSEAETLLRSSNHPNAKRLLQRIAHMKAAAQPAQNTKPRSPARSVWKYIAVTLYGFISSSN